MVWLWNNEFKIAYIENTIIHIFGGVLLKVYLRAFEYDDLNQINIWHNNNDMNSLTGGNRFFVSSVFDKKWLEDKMMNNINNVYCAVCITESGKMIGFISLNDIDYRNRKAHWGGMLIGDVEERKKGYATSAAYLMLKFGFEELNLNKITGYWLEDNVSSLLIGKRLGFQEEGKLNEEVFKNNKYNNLIIMSLFKENFQYVKENFGGN